MINKKKITKKIWYQDELWDFHTVLSPNKHDDFLVLARYIDSTHADGTPAVEMVMIDAHNQEFYPSNRAVNAIMKKRQKEDNERSVDRELLQYYWLNCIPDEC